MSWKDAGQAESRPQLLHGYDGGHRLLAASEALDDLSRELVDRLSDAVGTRPEETIDGYLTGYPLPDGRYAVAKTWYAWELPRPNCVWTHTIVLDSQGLASPMTLLDVLRGFRRPGLGQSLSDYSQPLEVGPQTIGPPWISPSIPFAQLLEIMSVLYQSEQPVTAAVDDGADRENIAIAVWLQQWPSLRKRFTFCTGALNIRTIGSRAFDLNLAPPTYLGYPTSSPKELPSDPEILVLAEDLIHPSIAFREYLEFAGSGSQRREVMKWLARIWLRLDGRLPGDLDSLASDILTLAPRPESMRRLKRRLFRIPGALVRDVASPTQVVTQLIDRPLGTAIRSDDASLTIWASDAWTESPKSLLDLYGVTRTGRDNAPRGDTAQQLAKSIVSTVILDRCTPAELRIVAGADPTLAARLVRARSHASWWVALSSMPPQTLTAVLTAIASIQPEMGQNDFEIAVASLVSATEPGKASTMMWDWLCTQNTLTSLRATIAAVSISVEVSGSPWIPMLSRNSAELESILASDPPWTWLPVLADAIDASTNILTMGLRPWHALIGSPQASRLGRGLALLTTIAIVDGHSDSGSIGLLYADLYRRLATQTASAEWALVRQHLPREHDEWDRCGLLLRGTAIKLSHYSIDDQQAAIGAAFGRDNEAGGRLAEALAARKPKRRSRRSWWSELLG